jgi:glucose/arabinose dehydrogenase
MIVRIGNTLAFAVLAALVVFAVPRPSHAAIAGLERVASGIVGPIYATHAPGDPSRLFILTRGDASQSTNTTAHVRILDLNTDTLLPDPFLTITGLSTRGEGGLLGMTFHPDYSNAESDYYGKFYLNYTTSPTTATLTTRIREFTVSETNPNVADPGSIRDILSIEHPQLMHKAGWMDFGPNDGYLYIATGDGGGTNDASPGHTPPSSGPPYTDGGNAQDITDNLLGKMLRIDVNGDDFTGDATRNYAIPPSNPYVGVTGDDEIWAYGLRNPFRAGFDRKNGDLYIGDVGQAEREEVNYQPGTSTGGENYGWRLREGDISTPTPYPPATPVGGAEPPNHSPPVHAYTHPEATIGPLSPPGYDGYIVTGGYVYRGPDPSLQGKYFFLDSRNTTASGDDNYWIADTTPFENVTNINSQMTRDTGLARFPVSFGEDAVGNLYITYIQSGEVYRIKTTELLPGDFNSDGDVNELDYNVWVKANGDVGSAIAADGNKDGAVDAADYIMWMKNNGRSVRDFGGGANSPATPEPATVVLLGQLFLVGTIAIARRPRHRA